MEVPGRSCPLAYRYQPEAPAQPAQLEADSLYVVGGLYGNPAALQPLLERTGREPSGPATVVFNGDVHWLDVDPDDFQAISETVLAHHAIKGNVEAELAATEDTGCGCAYPDYISDDVVERSNQIMTRLRATAGRFPELVGRLGELPRYLTASVGGQRIGILHGDPESLAGWQLALEAMEPGDPLVRRQVGWHGPPTTTADLLDRFGRAEVSVFACTHTGLPYAQDLADQRGRRRLVINNGSAGCPASPGPPLVSSPACRPTHNHPPTASMAPRWTAYAVTPCRWRSTSPGGEPALRRNGQKAVPPTTATSSASRAAPSCGSTKPSAARSRRPPARELPLERECARPAPAVAQAESARSFPN